MLLTAFIEQGYLRAHIFSMMVHEAVVVTPALHCLYISWTFCDYWILLPLSAATCPSLRLANHS
jgi:hypothetical protein